MDFVRCRFFNSHCREFHIASLPYKPDFKVMPEGWDGTVKDLDEVHYEISRREDEMLYQEFVQRMNFNKMKVHSLISRFLYGRNEFLSIAVRISMIVMPIILVDTYLQPP